MNEDWRYASFISEAGRVARALKNVSSVAIFSHIDADGITAGSIAYETASRLGKKTTIEFLKKLDEEAIQKIVKQEADMVWLNDMGSAYISKFEGVDMIIADHHLPEAIDATKVKSMNGRLPETTIYHLNPHLFGIDGGVAVSSAGIAYLIARAVSHDNIDLSPLALIGAVGDLQDSDGRLVGLNRIILEDTMQAGLVTVKRDARFYGKETRPLSKLLEYSVDPPIPGIAGQNSSAVRLLEALGIEFQKDGSELTWNEITEAERRRIISFIVTSMIAEGISAEIINQIIGETYVLNSEKGMLKDLKEFATLLNACGRYGEFSTAMRLCIQDRHEALQEALTLLENHRKNISAALRMIREEGMKQGEHLQYFHALDRMPDTIVGTVAGILMKSGEVDSRKVIVGFASSEGKIKVSARGNEELIQKGLDLSSAIRDAAASVGGVGGGHMIAAGATIDAGREEDFIKKLDECLRKQLLSG